MKIEFKDIPGFEKSHCISNNGIVKSKNRIVNTRGGGKKVINERILKRQLHSNGYLSVELNSFGKSKTFYIHQLVTMTFLNHKPNGHKIVVDHINEIKTDNRVENLQIVSNRENISRSSINKTGFKGVFWNEDSKLFEAIIRGTKDKSPFLGSSPSPIICSMLYELALRKHERTS